MTSPGSSRDPYELWRFESAQQGTFADAMGELGRGRKTSHWMWFVFPQILGLGSSPMSQRYAIKSKAEAKAYLEHPLLGPRLAQASGVLLTTGDTSAWEIMGHPDDLKLRSCMTLFASCSEAGSVFHRVLDRFFAGEADPKTLDILASLAS